MSVTWTLLSLMYSGESDGFHFTMGTAGSDWWWSAFESSAKPGKRGWVKSEFEARRACEAALDEMKAKRNPKAQRSA